MGHGLSEGERVYFNDLQVFVDDSVDHIKEMKEQYPGVPTFAIGHSMVRVLLFASSIHGSPLHVFSGWPYHNAGSSTTTESFKWNGAHCAELCFELNICHSSNEIYGSHFLLDNALLPGSLLWPLIAQ